jgi:hypothetical protein
MTGHVRTMLGNLHGSLDIEVGCAYEVERDTPLMPHHSPSSELAGILRMKTIPSGGAIEVVGQYMKRGYPWFEVEGGTHGRGWVSGIALVGQRLKKLRAPMMNAEHGWEEDHCAHVDVWKAARFNEASDEILRNVEVE